jgi:hypothetical protein
MRRRQLITYSAATSFVVALDLIAPQKSDAFLFALMRGALVEGLISLLAQSAFSIGINSYRRRNQEWFDQRLEAQLSQREFIAQNFTNVGAAEGLTDPTYRYIVGAEKYDNKGFIPAISFPQLRNDVSSVATYAGPACIGMAVASDYLSRNERLSTQYINSLVIPRFQAYNSWQGWDRSPAFISYPTISSDQGVLIRYDIVDSRPGGYGRIDVSINSNPRIVIPTIRVDFA